MKILLAIPSKNRAETLLKYTWSWAKDCKVDKVIFIENQDEENYRHFSHFGADLFILPENNKGLGYSCSQIKKYAQENEYDIVFKVDDDVRGFTRFRHRLQGEEITKKVDDFLLFFTKMFEKFKDIKAFTFPYSFQMYENTQFEQVKRCNTSYVIRTRDWLADPEIGCFEDYATGLWVITRGGVVLKYCQVGLELGIPVGKGRGGLQYFNRKEKMLQEMPAFQRRFPGIEFRKVDKEWLFEPDTRNIKMNQFKFSF